jgi:uncharacterized membrane protein YhaH (DUF805 family)
MLAAIEWNKIGELVWAAPLATLAVAVTFSVLILGVARAQDARREGDDGEAARYSVVALLALAAFAVVVVYGVTIIVQK